MNPLYIMPIQWRGHRWNQSSSNQHPCPRGIKVTGNSHHYNLSPIWLPSVMNPMDKEEQRVFTLTSRKTTFRDWMDNLQWQWKKWGGLQQSPIWNLGRWTAASAVPQVFCLTHLGSGIDHTQMTSNNVGRGQEQQSPKHGRRELPFSWIFPGWSDVLMETLIPASEKL